MLTFLNGLGFKISTFFYQISSYCTCKYLINNNFILIIFFSYNDTTYRNFYILSIFSIFIRYLIHYWSCFFRYVHNLFLCYDLFKGTNNYINANFFILLLFLSWTLSLELIVWSYFWHVMDLFTNVLITCSFRPSIRERSFKDMHMI